MQPHKILGVLIPILKYFLSIKSPNCKLYNTISLTVSETVVIVFTGSFVMASANLNLTVACGRKDLGCPSLPIIQ